ncbi:hypothetical protein DESA109040_18275 [Deinococcus saxicola]|uniref:recombinase family protein n=1 Tax=Deinococcus saxicola TaxID=249406 RepID=UPI0039F13AFD
MKLGSSQDLTLKARQRGAQARRSSAIHAYRVVSGYVQVLRAQGLTLQRIADRLNAEGHRTVMGKLWRPVQVRNVLLRVQGEGGHEGSDGRPEL